MPDVFDEAPKVELHLHLEGAPPIESLWQLVEGYGDPDVRSIDELTARFRYRDFPHFIDTWWWMTGFIRTLPQELEDAARMDGASEPRIMLSIMLPLTRPAMVIAGIHNAVPIWNDFFFPLVFIHTDARKTLPQGLTVFMGEFSTDWGALFAGLTLSALPIIVIYLLLSRQFIAGLTSGAVK